MKNKIIALVLSLLCFMGLFPVIFILVGSFGGSIEMRDYLSPLWGGGEAYISPNVIPSFPTLQSYVDTLIDRTEFIVMFWNSIFYVTIILVGQLIIAVPAAWALTRVNHYIKSIIVTFYTVLMTLPFALTMLPQYMVLDYLDLINTRWAMILTGIFSPFSVFILYYYLRNVPTVLIEQARIDGAGNWSIFVKIVLPIGKPGIISSVFLGFIESWNMLEQPMMFIENKKLWPITLFFANITIENSKILFAASTITLIPAIYVFYMGYMYLEQGFSNIVSKE